MREGHNLEQKCKKVFTPKERKLEEKVSKIEPKPMSTQVYPCDYPVPENGIIDGYTGTTNSTCSYCDAVCKLPAVSSEIHFLDGYNYSLVNILYGSVFVGSFLY